MEFQEMVKRAGEVRAMYAAMEKRLYTRSWNSEELALGFVGDVGDLAKLVQAVNGVRNIEGAREKLAHELSDCLWSVIAISKACDIDLETAFFQTMDELEAHMRQKGAD